MFNHLVLCMSILRSYIAQHVPFLFQRKKYFIALVIVKMPFAKLQNKDLDGFFFAVVTTIEGILQRTINGLLQDQPVRRHMAPEDAQKIDEYVDKVKEIMKVEKPFSMVNNYTFK